MGKSREVMDEIRRRVNILDVISSHVTLRRSGRNYKGLCPFHSEKTPSFNVDPDRGFFYCFGCHAGGDVFDFVMRIGTRTFGEAREELAARAGIRLDPTPEEARASGERERLLRVADASAAFFRAQLGGPAGGAARRYLDTRGIALGIRESFRLGFAPPGWDNLLRALQARGFDAGIAEQAGVAVSRSSGGHYDALRDRLIFPIHDLQGRPVAFGGRVLNAEGSPKYLNTRETPLFIKGKTLYALNDARDAIRETGVAVVVEGYMDALACHQFGVRNAVASLGTALTIDQVLLLKRFASRAILVYDADAAGVGAAERGLEVFEQAELPVRVAVLPGESDPDAFLRRDGPEAFQGVCNAALPIFDYRMAMAARRHDDRTVEGKVGIVNELSQLIISATNPVRQGEYVRLLADRLGVREDAIRGQLRRVSRPRGEGAGTPGSGGMQPVSDASARAGTEELLLHVLVSDATVRTALRGAVEATMFTDPGHRELAAALLADGPGAEAPERLRGRLRDETAVSLLSRFLIAQPPGGDPHRMADACVRRLRRFTLQERVDGLLRALREADRARNEERVQALQIELRELYRELKVSVQAP